MPWNRLGDTSALKGAPPTGMRMVSTERDSLVGTPLKAPDR